MSEQRAAWERRPHESARAHAVFRQYRDLGPSRTLAMLGPELATSARHWCTTHDWRERAVAWDDHLAMVEDAERIESLRAMHRNHARAGRAALQIAVEGMRSLNAAELTAGDVCRLLDLGARLERATLVESVDDLLGRTPHLDDPWERIARELADSDPH